MNAVFKARWYSVGKDREASVKSDETTSGTFGTAQLMHKPEIRVVQNFSHEAIVKEFLATNPTPDELCHKLFGVLLELFKHRGPEVPVRLDDMSARCANRMGSWSGICKSWPRDASKAKREFESCFKEFWHHKESGFYNEDLLPTITGINMEVFAYRLRVGKEPWGGWENYEESQFQRKFERRPIFPWKGKP